MDITIFSLKEEIESYTISNILNRLLKILEEKHKRAKVNKEYLGESYYALGYYDGLTRGYNEAVNDLINCIKENRNYV